MSVALLQGDFPTLPENPGLAASRTALTRARKTAARKAQAEAAAAQEAAQEAALQEQTIYDKIHEGIDQLFTERADDPTWWRSGDMQQWLADICAQLAERAPRDLNLDARKICIWINHNSDLQDYISGTYDVAQAILEALNEIPRDEWHDLKELVQDVQDKLIIHNEYKWLIKPLVTSEFQMQVKRLEAKEPSSSRRASSRIRQQDPEKVAARVRQLGPLTSTLVDLLVNWNQKFESAEDLYATLQTRGVAQPVEDQSFVEHAFEIFQLMQQIFTEAIQDNATSVSVQSLRDALNANSELAQLKVQDERMVHVINSLARALIQKYTRKAKIQKWATRAAVFGGTAALFSILAALRYNRKQNPRRRQ